MASRLTLWEKLREVEVLGGIADGIGKAYSRFFGSRNERVISEHLALVAAVNDQEAFYESLSDDELKDESTRLRGLLEEKIKEYGGHAILERVEELRRTLRSEDADEESKKYRKIEDQALTDILPQAFAAMREATKRRLRIRHYDVQLLGGIFLHQNRIAEMITGEGKTLVASLPCYLNALPGLGVHVVTVNDYLARRDRDWNAQFFEVLGLNIGVIQSHMDNEKRRMAYACDVTYGTNSEFGFDYLRDNMKTEESRQVQGRFKRVPDGEDKTKLVRVNERNAVLGNLNFAIVDEVDSILIDDARTPLIISGGVMHQTDAYYTADSIAQRLKGIAAPKLEAMAAEQEVEKAQLEDKWDYVYNEKNRSVYYTEAGLAKAEKMLGRGSLFDPQNHDWPHYIEQAISARQLYKKDVQYVVENGEVVIVDENTGRMMYGRTWSDGLHQAIEAKEGLKIKEETQTVATVTLQNYFRLYSKLAGMTGTAMTEAAEFQKIYNLDTVAMPTNWPLQRANYGDVVYRTLREKNKAICGEVEAVNAIGRPILVGTVTVENSERLSEMLQRRGIEHEVLNAKRHQHEASIVAIAGQLGRVTIATNMAGRGTDIVLGSFTRQQLLDYWKAHKAAPKDLEIGDPKFYDKLIEHQKARILSTGVSLYEELEYREFLKTVEHNGQTYKTMPLCEHVRDLGGLHIVGSERHESRRIDNQLRGRCGRQGDPGSSRFYLSLEDDLMRIFASDRVSWVLEKIGMEEGQEITAKMVTNSIEKAQKKVESHHFDMRKNLLEYDSVMDEQRKLVYNERQSVLSAKDLDPILERWFETSLDARLNEFIHPAMGPHEWDLGGLSEWAMKAFGFRVVPKDLQDKSRAEVYELLWKNVDEAYKKRREEQGGEAFKEVERFILLEKIDEKWKDHLHAMDQLRSSIGYAGYAQEDPKVKYKRTGYDYFEEMWSNIADEVTDLLFRVRIVKDQELKHSDKWGDTQEVQESKESFEEKREQRAEEADKEAYGGSQGSEKKQPERRAEPKVSRNAPCTCGSGKKFKKCCGKKKK